MARAAISKKLTTKPKTTRPRTSTAVRKSMDLKTYGSEPVDISKIGLANALNWYNYMYEPDETRSWLFDYLKKQNYTKQDIAAIRRAPKQIVSKTVCTVARILYNGNDLPDNSMAYFTRAINDALAAGKSIKEEVKEEVATKPEPTIQERTQAKIQLLLTDCEEAIDQDPNLNIYEWLTGKEATPAAANAIRDHYARWIEDFEYVDEHATRSEKKRNAERLKYWQQFTADCDRYVGNKKVAKIRKPREKKAKPAVDLVKKLKYQKEFPPLKIVSVNPADIIGANQLWTYNTKYKKLTRFDAAGPSGIQVKGATLIGFDAETSCTKSLRKPDMTIQSLLGAGKIALRKLMDDLKTNETKPTGRINTDTVLLRVIK